MWMGGTVPLGFDVRDRKLAVNAAEAETVRLIFARYAELGSVTLLQAELDRRGLRSKRREGAGGRLGGGRRFSRGILYLILKNRWASLRTRAMFIRASMRRSWMPARSRRRL